MSILIVIGGPTASGKTKAAIALSKVLKCPIISADSRQFYREMNIGTAKPTPEELAKAPHYFINNKSVGEAFSAGTFEKEVLELLETIFSENEYAILVGGSGLYIDSVCFGLDELPKSSEMREILIQECKTYGLEKLQLELKEKDSAYYSSCDNQNPVRVIRALEMIRLTGKKMSELQQNKPKFRDFKTHFLILDLPRAALYRRIDDRVDQMIQNGLIEEARKLYPMRDFPALRTVGYQEIFGFFDEEYPLERAIELIKRNSRRYAKRQITWFKKYEHAHWLPPEAFENAESIVALASSFDS